MRRGPRVAGLAVLGGLVLLVALAGCVGPFADGGSGDSGAGTATGEGSPIGTASATGVEGNPFDQPVVQIRVNDTVGDGRNTTELVARAIDFWNPRIERYTPFDYRFALASDPAEARLEIRFVESIDDCGENVTVEPVGCAPRYQAGDTAPETTVVRVAVHGSNSAVTGTVKHELGHVLGLLHDDEPLALMAHRSDEPVRNATERAVPWHSNELAMYVDHDSLQGDRDRIDAQVGHALAYYNDGAAGTIPDNVTFTRTDVPAAADVVVTDADRYGCADAGQTLLRTKGYKRVDGDPAFEMYTRVIVCVDVDADALGWYVGYWLGDAMGLPEADRAPPFVDAGYFDRRSDWWE